MLLTRRIDVLAILASFAFIGAILLGMFWPRFRFHKSTSAGKRKLSGAFRLRV